MYSLQSIPISRDTLFKYTLFTTHTSPPPPPTFLQHYIAGVADTDRLPLLVAQRRLVGRTLRADNLP